MKQLKYLIWLYYLLLIFEGALRKWVFPGLSDVLLVIRDPVVILIYVIALQRGLISFNNYTTATVALAISAFAFALTFGHGNLIVAVFGIRTNFLFIPLIFIIPRVFDREDVWLIGKVTLLLSLPMTLLISLQFISPQSAWVNTNIGGGVGTALSGALGHFRPSGTFSFINGTVLFYSLAFAFLLSFLAEMKRINRLLLLMSAISILMAFPVSISRTLVLSGLLSLLFMVYALMVEGKVGRVTGRVVLFAMVSLFVLSQLPVFSQGVNAFLSRWESATGAESGGFQEAIVGRFFWNIFGPLYSAGSAPFFGDGVGIGTNVGAQLTTGSRFFLLGESEFFRIIGELGLLLGIPFIMLRVIFVLQLSITAHRYVKKNHLLPWLILSSIALPFASGQWGQPTALGFAIFGGGISIAAFRERKAIQPRLRKPVPQES